MNAVLSLQISIIEKTNNEDITVFMSFIACIASDFIGWWRKEEENRMQYCSWIVALLRSPSILLNDHL